MIFKYELRFMAFTLHMAESLLIVCRNFVSGICNLKHKKLLKPIKKPLKP